MGRKIKLIWDFRGPTAKKTAVHHEAHLKEYITLEKTNLNITGHRHIDERYSLAFMVVEEHEMIGVRDALRPHRAEIYTDQEKTHDNG